jgi:hypothetical protein
MKWTNLSSFSDATVLFKFRKIPSFNLTVKHVIVCKTGRYRILSIEDVKNRGMYYEILCDEVKPDGQI